MSSFFEISSAFSLPFRTWAQIQMWFQVLDWGSFYWIWQHCLPDKHSLKIDKYIRKWNSAVSDGIKRTFTFHNFILFSGEWGDGATLTDSIIGKDNGSSANCTQIFASFFVAKKKMTKSSKILMLKSEKKTEKQCFWQDLTIDSPIFVGHLSLALTEPVLKK